VNHLIQSYHKHYNENLSTIPEESFGSQLSSTKEKPKFIGSPKRTKDTPSTKPEIEI